MGEKLHKEGFCKVFDGDGNFLRYEKEKSWREVCKENGARRFEITGDAEYYKELERERGGQTDNESYTGQKHSRKSGVNRNGIKY